MPRKTFDNAAGRGILESFLLERGNEGAQAGFLMMTSCTSPT
jgi:hypothetical protein